MYDEMYYVWTHVNKLLLLLYNEFSYRITVYVKMASVADMVLNHHSLTYSVEVLGCNSEQNRQFVSIKSLDTSELVCTGLKVGIKAVPKIISTLTVSPCVHDKHLSLKLMFKKW